MVPPKTERFELRLDEELLDQVDAWRRNSRDVPTRAEAVRRLIEVGLAKNQTFAPQFSDGEKLLIFMVADVLKALPKARERAADTDLITSAISGGHYWALRWDLQGIFHDSADTPEAVGEVADILDMWMFLESGHAKLSDAEKTRVEREAEPFGSNVKFVGFDGNNETSYMHIARFFIEKMGRWGVFKGRELNSHTPVLGLYRQMYRAFEPMRKTLAGTNLSANQIISILTENTRSGYRQSATNKATMKRTYWISDKLTKGTVDYKRWTLPELNHAFDAMKPTIWARLPDAKISVLLCDGQPRVRQLEIDSPYDDDTVDAALMEYLDAHKPLLADTRPPPWD